MFRDINGFLNLCVGALKKIRLVTAESDFEISPHGLVGARPDLDRILRRRACIPV